MGWRVRFVGSFCIFVFLVVADAGGQVIQGEVLEQYPDFIGTNDQQVQEPNLIEVTLDGFLFSRPGTGGSDPLLFDDPVPFGQTMLQADELDFEGELGGRLDVKVIGLHFNYLWTGTASTSLFRNSEPEADIWFFNVHDADDSPEYTARYQSRLSLGDLGFTRDITPFWTLSAGVAIGELSESMDLITEFEPTLNGFYSQATNDLYGLRLAADGQLWSNGYTKLVCNVSGGAYYNDIQVHAQSLNLNRSWTGDDVAFSGTANIAFVVPAYPFNFRIGYQATAITGVGLLPDESRVLDLWDGSGEVTTDSTLYHGLLFGIEFVR